MAANCFLATYHPLAQTSCGRQAIREHALLPFIDGSCRREPDFESRFPSITATCRGRNCAPRLCVFNGQRQIYWRSRTRLATGGGPESHSAISFSRGGRVLVCAPGPASAQQLPGGRESCEGVRTHERESGVDKQETKPKRSCLYPSIMGYKLPQADWTMSCFPRDRSRLDRKGVV